MAGPKPKVRDDLSWVVLEGETIIYDGQTRNVHHLNGPATVVFQLCDGCTTVRDMAGQIGAAFDVPVGRVERQVRALVRDLRKAKLLEGTVKPIQGG